MRATLGCCQISVKRPIVQAVLYIRSVHRLCTVSVSVVQQLRAVSGRAGCPAQNAEFGAVRMVQLHVRFGLGQGFTQLELPVIGEQGTGQNAGPFGTLAFDHHT